MRKCVICDRVLSIQDEYDYRDYCERDSIHSTLYKGYLHKAVSKIK